MSFCFIFLFFLKESANPLRRVCLDAIAEHITNTNKQLKGMSKRIKKSFLLTSFGLNQKKQKFKTGSFLLKMSISFKKISKLARK